MTEKETKEFCEAMLIKSEEAYLMSMEIINKPTLNYRTEGFCFFISNAWELLLKTFLVMQKMDYNTILYKDKSGRTIGLDECIERVFTSTTDTTKLNLSMIREFRNKATHSILPEYDYAFSSIFQRTITNYNIFFKKHFPDYPLNASVTAFVALSNVGINEKSPLSLNPKNMNQFINLKSKAESNEAINHRITLTSVKHEKDADFKFSLNPESTDSINFVKVPKDVNSMYPYTTSQVIKYIKESLELSMGENHRFTNHTFHKICKIKKIKDDTKYCYTFDYGVGVRKYTETTVEYISYLYKSDKQLQKRFGAKIK